ncbi:MAG: hypothetical protein D6698_08630 [Gammaproteobacteria bacterium]|nr:MAG: hypothetical protein D6698_08630 [Gammaproteobacteria bacterium]
MRGFLVRSSSRLYLKVLVLLICSTVLSGGGCSIKKKTGVTGAVIAPLSDLNLVREKIPDLLLEIKKDPYALPEDMNCSALRAAVLDLDEILGPDLDDLSKAEKPGAVEKGSRAAGAAAVGVLRNTTEGVIPFRGWVRRLTGAQRHYREITAAVAAGVVRRAFLKGLRVAQGCPIPGSVKDSNEEPAVP